MRTKALLLPRSRQQTTRLPRRSRTSAAFSMPGPAVAIQIVAVIGMPPSSAPLKPALPPSSQIRLNHGRRLRTNPSKLKQLQKDIQETNLIQVRSHLL